MSDNSAPPTNGPPPPQQADNRLLLDAVAASVALGVTGTICYLAILGHDVPAVLAAQLGLIVGYFYSVRSAPPKP